LNFDLSHSAGKAQKVDEKTLEVGTGFQGFFVVLVRIK